MPSQPTSIQSQSPDSPQRALSPSFKDAYQWGKIIGHGTQGNVYNAVRIADNQKVVIKQINIHSIHNWKEYDLFRREVQVLKSLDIPGVAKFYEAAECLDDNPPCAYIVQEYIPGKDLAQLINGCHRFTLDTIYDILIQTLSIIDQLHHHNPPIIHRDIKPSNLMLSPDGKVTIIDFGAVANPQIQSGGSTVAGTIGFMPTEQLMGKPEPASDIYALAAVALQLITGIHPADIPTQDFYLIFEPLMQDKPHELVRLLRQMLDPKADQRLADIPEIIRRLEQLKTNQIIIETADASETVLRKDGYTQSYLDRLSAVESICQTGNIDLWQQLPESTPRPFPQIYRPFVEIKRKSKDAPMPVFDPKSVLMSVNETNHTKESRWKDHYILFLSIFISFILFTVLLFTGKFQFKFGIETFILIILIPILINLAVKVLSLFIPFPLYKFVIEPILKTTVHNEVELDNKRSVWTTARLGHRDMLDFPNCIEELFCNGRKTIAIIVDIQYIECSEMDISNTQTSERHICLPTPCFKVSYSFNPPDDNRQDNIIHSFLTDVEPENHYKLRDTLPILYSVNKMYSYDMVTSMPFPLPLFDAKYLMHIIDRSFSNFNTPFVIYHNDNGYNYSSAYKNITDLLIKLHNNQCDNDKLREFKLILSDNNLYPLHAIYIKYLIESSSSPGVNKNTYEIIVQYLEKLPRTKTQPMPSAVHYLCSQIFKFDHALRDHIATLLIDLYIDRNVSKELKTILYSYRNDVYMPEKFQNYMNSI